METNAYGPLVLCQNLIPLMEGYGRVVNVSSGMGQLSEMNGGCSGYRLSKVALNGVTRILADELKETEVKVNSVCPGNFFDGPLWADPEKGLFVQYLNAGKVPGAQNVEDVKAFYEAKVPMGRGCTGRDVMISVYYIVEQRYETGQAIPVTGGQVMLN